VALHADGNRDASPLASAADLRGQVWGKTWYPLQFEALADKTAPSSCTILGAQVGCDNKTKSL
jgi:hypothetical protein